MTPRILHSLFVPILLLAGCDRPAPEAEKKPEPPPAAVEPAVALAPAPAPPAEVSEASPDTPPPPAEVPTQSPDAPYRVGGEITWPEVIRKVSPDYSAFDREVIRPRGVNITELVIDEKGDVQEVRTLKGSHPKIDEAVITAVRQWKFKPATLKGRPVRVYFTLTVNVDIR